jgi:hypothetical protein
MRYLSVAAVAGSRSVVRCNSVFQHDAQMRQRRRLPFAPNAANYFHGLVHTIAASPRGGAFAMHDNEQAIVWIRQDSASAIVAITGFVAVFVVAMALAMV